MNSRFCSALVAVLLSAQIAFAQDVTSKTVSAANAFLKSLNDDQRGEVVFKFSDEAQKKKWSNLPTSMVPRNGLRMGNLTAAQRDGVWAVLAAALSPSGYEKIRGIVDADEALKNASKGGPAFGKDEYFVSFVGQPSNGDPWIIQFGGHHLGINVTFVGNRESLTPSHTGVQPAIYQLEGKTIRPLGREADKSFEMINALDEAQRKQAILGAQMRDLVLGPGRDGQMIQPEGVKASALNAKQRELLLDLASEWVNIESESAAKVKMAELKKNIEETWFAWSGPTEKGSASYFRIQGPTVFIEYAPQRLGGDPTKHIHTIYRDPTNEYGAGFIKKAVD